MTPMPADPSSAFRRALLYCVHNSGGSLPMMRLNKLLYLADLEYFNRYGRTMTNAPWVRQKYGPTNRAMLPSVHAMSGHEVEEERKRTQLNREVYLVKDGPAPRFSGEMSPRETEVLDFVLATTARLSDEKVQKLAYGTTPMQLVLAREEVAGRKLLDEPLDFVTMSDPSQLPESDQRPDMDARMAAQREDMAAMAPFLARALGESA
jgi:uncharacterized phage-associated protein